MKNIFIKTNRKFADQAKAWRGDFELQIFNDKNELVGYVLEQNLIVTAGRAQMAQLIGGAGTAVTQIAFGTGSVAPAPGDVGLTGAFTKNITTLVPGTGVTFPTSTQARFTWTLETTENNGMSITEYGLFTLGGVLFARKVRSAIAKTSAIRIVGTWTINF